MKRTILTTRDFEKQAAAILAASKEKRGDGLRMERIENDEDNVPGSGGGGGTDDPPEDDEDEDDEDDSTDDEDDDDENDKSKSKKDDEDDKVDRAEYDRVKRHRAAADRRNAELTAENTRLKNENAALKAEGKDGKLDEATTARVTELESNVEKRDQEIHRLRIANAFLASNSHDWADPEDALRLADLSDVEIEEDGTVHGLKQALDRLAKRKPHLLKSKSDEDKGKGPSGSANNGRRKGQTKKPDRDALSKSYPILAARR